MIAVDTNVLVHAHRGDSALHRSAHDRIKELAEGTRSWAIPVHCLVEFYGVVTHPGIWKTPSRPERAVDQIRAWRESPTLTLLGDDEATVDRIFDTAVAALVAGPKVHDARIAATCLSHGVSELWTIDRDFSRFGGLKAVNPLGSP